MIVIPEHGCFLAIGIMAEGRFTWHVPILRIPVALGRGLRAMQVDDGAHLGLCTGDPGLESAIANFSRYGVDAALITAATKSSEPLELAAKLLRDRGRISIIGDVGMGVSRATMYRKEISLAMSRSYGPGRYDPHYEEGGQDYPIGYVRWTEKRNMEAFLDLLSSGALQRQGICRRRSRRLHRDHRLPRARRCTAFR